jgi:filamentous hemagglutinin family protein
MPFTKTQIRSSRLVFSTSLSLASALVLASSQAQNILPTNGVVTSGAASIRQSGADLSITQMSPRAIVNWGGFSIGPANGVAFDQPSASSAILNRVTGSATSTIAGQLRSNGQVYLVNPNGIEITKTGVVRAGGGFVASTLGIADNDFNSGNLNFVGNGASAGVANAGSIQAGPGGFVGLLGGTVSNPGVVSVPLGKVAMGSGEQATLNLTGDNFLQVAIPTNTKTANGQALVDVSGKVRAAGGSVQLKAATVAQAIRNAVNVPGELSVASARASGGSIILSGGLGGDLAVSGKLAASGLGKGGTIAVSGHNAKLNHATLVASGAGGRGGAVTVTGTNAVSLASTAVDASGAIGGGAIRVGGDFHGASDVASAETTTIDSASTLNASATAYGNGGTVAVWSNGVTSVRGVISAQGGPWGGDGGQVETSGETLDYAGVSVRASSLYGKPGSWLLDPEDLTVDSVAATTIQNSLNGGTPVTLQTTSTTASGPGTISSGAGDINVDAAISWSTAATLTLSAFHSIIFNAPMTIGGPGDLVLQTNNNVGGTSTGGGALTFTMGQGSVQYTGGPSAGAGLKINNNSYTLVYDMTGVASMNNSSGNFALAVPIDASTSCPPPCSSGTWPSSPVPTFSGKFEGLGNTISNLTILATGNVPQGTSTELGLFGTLSTGFPPGSIENLGLVGGSVTNASTHAVSNSGNANAAVGDLVGENSGTITNVYETGTVSGGTETKSNVGGLVGDSLGGTITFASATGAVSSSGSGSDIGGLVGHNETSTSRIADAYATGAVTGGAGSFVGGFAGANDAGTITDAYATGTVTGGSGASVGGFSGELSSFGTGTITDAYATGAVSGGAGASVGGLVGTNSGGTIIDAYWDTGTTGQSSSAGGVGMTTAQLQAALPAFQNPGSWGIVAGKSYPYLCFQFAGCTVTPQVVSGVAYSDQAGTTPAAAGLVVDALVNGAAINSVLTGSAVTTGANGYYYYLLAPGSIPANGAVLTYANGVGSVNGAALVDQIAGGNASNANIFANTLHIVTPAALYSIAQADLTTALGNNSSVIGFVAGLPNLTLDASNAFTIDQAISYPSGVVTATALGDLTIGAGGSLAANTVTLATQANFINQAGAGAISLQGSGGRWLVYSTNPNLDTDGGLTPNFYQYNAPYTFSPDSGTPPAAAGNGFLYSFAPTITITGVTKTYDATTALPNVAANYPFSGANSGDSVALNVSGVAGSYATPNAGTGIDVTMTTLPTVIATRGGVPVFGYAVAPVSNDPIGTINPASLTASLTGTVQKSYDGTTLATLNPANHHDGELSPPMMKGACG